jgi:hypothetical protein
MTLTFTQYVRDKVLRFMAHHHYSRARVEAVCEMFTSLTENQIIAACSGGPLTIQRRSGEFWIVVTNVRSRGTGEKLDVLPDDRPKPKKKHSQHHTPRRLAA